jgi:hypothetical protein
MFRGGCERLFGQWQQTGFLTESEDNHDQITASSFLGKHATANPLGDG